MIFNKAGKLIPQQFIYDGKPLECVKSYKYLGIHFVPLGHLPLHRVNCIKSTQSTFKLKRAFVFWS